MCTALQLYLGDFLLTRNLSQTDPWPRCWWSYSLARQQLYPGWQNSNQSTLFGHLYKSHQITKSICSLWTTYETQIHQTQHYHMCIVLHTCVEKSFCKSLFIDPNYTCLHIFYCNHQYTFIFWFCLNCILLFSSSLTFKIMILSDMFGQRNLPAELHSTLKTLVRNS